MKKFLSIAAVAFFSLAGAAHAALLDVTLGSTMNSVSSFNFGGTLNSDITLPAPGILTSTGNVQVITSPNFLTNEYALPTGALSGNNYLAVIATPGTPGVATFTLSANQNTFGFTWGTIDSYNTLVLTDSRDVTYTLTGTAILGFLSSLGVGTDPGTTQSDVNFIDPFGQIVSAVLTSSTNSFEAANFSQSSVPLPAALPLFGVALFGLYMFARRNRRVAVKA